MGVGTLTVGGRNEDGKEGDITVTGKLGAGREDEKNGIFSAAAMPIPAGSMNGKS